VRVAKPPPVPSSGFLPLSTVLAAFAARTDSSRSSPFAVTPRRFAALFHAARVPGVALQSFPFSRSRTRSRGPFLPCGFAFDHPTARNEREIRGHFPRRADPLPRQARWARRTHGPGRRFLLVASRHQVHARERVHGTVDLVRTGLAWRQPARPLRSFAPLESPFTCRPRPGQGLVDWSVLSWAFFPSRVCSSRSWVRSFARARVIGITRPRSPPRAQLLATRAARFKLRS